MTLSWQDGYFKDDIYDHNSSLSLHMHDYIALLVVVMICGTQVNTQTHTHTQRHTDSFHPATLLAQPSIVAI